MACPCGWVCPQGVGAVGCGSPQAGAGTDGGEDWPGPCTFMIKGGRSLSDCPVVRGQEMWETDQGRAEPGGSRMGSLLQTPREQGQEQEGRPG